MNDSDPGTQKTVTDASAGTIQAQPDTTTPAPASGSAGSGTPSVRDQLPGLRAEFPCFRIWHEDACDCALYMSRSLHLEINPHTVMTGDIGELRAALEPARHTPCPWPYPAGQAPPARPRPAAAP